ncbi:MAG: YHS domain-containing protein [Candidatus Longimicrobiales bacterium M2_2A_002]
MRARDPVCGMNVDAEASVSERYEGLVFHFCAPGCADAFRADPRRYLEATAEGTAPLDDPLTLRPCPACGESARAAACPAEVSLPIPIPELATLVRNEWRRRLGRGRYDEAHPVIIARWALLAAVRSDEDAPGAVAAALVAEGIRRGRCSPLNARAELHHLLDAVDTVLSAQGLGTGLTEVVRASTVECLGAWPSRGSRGATTPTRPRRIYLRSGDGNLR